MCDLRCAAVLRWGDRLTETELEAPDDRFQLSSLTCRRDLARQPKVSRANLLWKTGFGSIIRRLWGTAIISPTFALMVASLLRSPVSTSLNVMVRPLSLLLSVVFDLLSSLLFPMFPSTPRTARVSLPLSTVLPSLLLAVFFFVSFVPLLPGTRTLVTRWFWTPSWRYLVAYDWVSCLAVLVVLPYRR